MAVDGPDGSSSSGDEEPQKSDAGWSPLLGNSRSGKDHLAGPLVLQALPQASRVLDPLEVRFSQMKMRHLFGDGRRVADTVHQMRLVRCSDAIRKETGAVWKIEAPFPSIEVLLWRSKIRDEATGKGKVDPNTGDEMYDSEEHWFTLDNRRLYCLQEMALRVWPERAVADVSVILSGPTKHMRELRKFRTFDKGRSIAIGSRAGGVNFVRWCWRTKAGEAASDESEGEFLQLRAEGMLVEKRPKADILTLLSQVEPDSDERIQLSKRLSWVLRRGATQSGVPMDSEGWARVEDLNRAECLRGITIDKLLSVIEESNRQKFRYDIRDDAKRGKLIRASGKKAHGHSDAKEEPNGMSNRRTATPLPAPIGSARPQPAARAVERPEPLRPEALDFGMPPGFNFDRSPGLDFTATVGRLAASPAKVPTPTSASSGGNARSPNASTIRGPVTPGAVVAPSVGAPGSGAAGGSPSAASSPSADRKAAKAVQAVSNKTQRAPTAPGAFQLAPLGKGGPPGSFNAFLPSFPARPPGTFPGKGGGKMSEAQVTQLMTQMQALHNVIAMSAMTRQYQFQLRLQEIFKIKFMQQLKYMSDVHQAQMMQQMEAMWGEVPEEMTPDTSGELQDWDALDWTKGMWKEDENVADDQEYFDPSNASVEQFEAKFNKAIQQAQERHGWETAANAAPEQLAKARSAPDNPADLEAKIQQTLQAAMQRNATARQQEQWQQQQLEHEQSAAWRPMKVSVGSALPDATSLEAKAAAALAAARQRSGGGAAATPPGQAGGRQPGGGRAAPAAPAASLVDLQATFAAALEAAKARSSRAAA